MKLLSFKGILHLCYAIGFTFIAIVALVASPYYGLPLGERPHNMMHDQFKPGGLWGHGLGIIGSSMVLLLFLYSARKRQRFGLRAGRLSRWLDVHIMFGILGPLLITLHTAMKFHGLVSISYYSMVVVALSGVFGRYVYMQIPRDTRGDAMSMGQVRSRIDEVRGSLIDRLPPDIVAGVDRFVGEVRDHRSSGLAALFQAARADLVRPWRLRRLKRYLRRGKTHVSEHEIRQIVRLAKEEAMLVRRMARMDAMTRTLHYWHVFHKPFAYIMITIMMIHVAVAVSFGYTWVF
jgi:hypothetical protein